MTEAQSPDHRRTVLVADPDAEVRAFVALTLEGPTYQVLEAEDGESALWHIAQHIPDAVLVDTALPGASGLAVSHSINAQPETRHVRVVVLYPRGQAVDRPRGTGAGVDAWLAKPFTALSLLLRLESLLSPIA